MNAVSPRTQTAIGFLTAAVALAFATMFIMVDVLQPVFAGDGASGLSGIAEAFYPFPGVTEVRLGYCTLALLPILLPLISGNRAAALATLVLGVLIKLTNIQDAVWGYLLEGRVALGVLFTLAILLPSLIGLAGAWRWWRQPA